MSRIPPFRVLFSTLSHPLPTIKARRLAIVGSQTHTTGRDVSPSHHDVRHALSRQKWRASTTAPPPTAAVGASAAAGRGGGLRRRGILRRPTKITRRPRAIPMSFETQHHDEPARQFIYRVTSKKKKTETYKEGLPTGELPNSGRKNCLTNDLAYV
jgi:hypothetical protein